MARLILLTGVGGAGTTTLARATVEALQSEGLVAVAVDGSGDTLADPVAVDAVARAVGSLFAELGADPLPSEAWSALPGLSHLSALTRAAAALADADAVVVDCGPLTRAREMVEAPATIVRLLDAALTPRMAMWRSARGEDVAFTSLSAGRSAAVRLHQMLLRPATTVRLVSTPTSDGAIRTMRALGALSTLGVGVDGVVVNRFPRPSEGASKRDVRAGAEVLASLTAAADGMAVWKSTSAVRAVPKGRSAMGPLGRVHVIDADQLTVHVSDDAFHLDLPLAGPARAEARVGVQGGSLVVALDSLFRWIDLPPVLRRCRPTHADRTASGLRVTFLPDPSLWREPAVEEEVS